MDDSDILSKIDIDKMKFAIDYSKLDGMEARTGVSGTQLQSVLRDRITNGLTKLAILGSKMSVAKAGQKKDKALQELLLDPKSIDHLRDIADANKITNAITTPKALKELGQRISAMGLKGQYFAEQGAEGGQEEPQQGVAQ